ncbi:hypothetical protein A3194_02575 [Candidatus Thiodiazotropha endoloripes]|nr:hypothetical protein A3194_02575 [Candidatus Thiodiazotropha endoloripes]
MIILLYLAIETLAYIAFQASLLSDHCLISQICSPADSLIWLVGVTASQVHAGARKINPHPG